MENIAMGRFCCFLLFALFSFVLHGCSTPLMQAVGRGDRDFVIGSVKAGADVNERTRDHRTALHAAAWSGQAEIAKLLIDHGAELDGYDGSGRTPLFTAVLRNHPAVVRVLVANGAETEKKGVYGGMPIERLTPLQLASKKGYAEIVQILSASRPSQSEAIAYRPKPAPPAPIEPKTLSDVQSFIPVGKKAGRYDIAVVIGNRVYTAGAPEVDYALRDASTLREYLVKALGYEEQNIIYAENATGSRFNEIFGREGDHRGQLFKWVKENESRVFIYYVGHGAPDPDTGDAYFVPVDSNPQFLKSSGYRLKTFYDNLANLPAKSITVVLDACFSGNSSKGLLFKGVSSIAMRPKAVQAPAQAIVFASARDDQMANWYPDKQHSLFTYYFLKGLQGEADGNLDRRITVAEMEAFLDENVPYMARRLNGAEQQPSISGRRDSVLAVLEK